MATDTAASRRRTATVHLPLVTAELHAPHLPRPHLAVPHVSVPRPSIPTLPGRRQMTDLGRGVSSLLPPKDQLALYGGLGAAAALGLLDWPVAAAVAAGTAVARHGTLRGSFADVARAMSDAVREPAPEQAAAPASTAKRSTSKRTTAKKTTARRASTTTTGRRATKRTAAAT